MYLTIQELRKIATVLETLNSLDESVVSLGPLDVYDTNGEIVGKIDASDSGRAFYPSKQVNDD